MNPELAYLMTVEDRFQLEHLGLVLAPDFSVPDGQWSDQTHSVMIEAPEGQRFQTQARFGLSHLNIRDPNVSLDRRWRVTVTLPEIRKEQVPPGSKVFADVAIVSTLHPKKETQQAAP